MSQPTLTYFDFPGGRGEDCRLALHIAGVDFHDDRVSGATWGARKGEFPFGRLPIYSEPGRGVLTQSNAILGYLGRQHGLHPTDAWEAARHESVMAAVEDLRADVSGTSRGDADQKREAREAFAAGPLKQWAGDVEAMIEGPFLAGDSLHVADLKLFMVMRWFCNGAVDHVPSDCFAAFPKLSALYDAVAAHPGVVSWYAR